MHPLQQAQNSHPSHTRSTFTGPRHFCAMLATSLSCFVFQTQSKRERKRDGHLHTSHTHHHFTRGGHTSGSIVSVARCRPRWLGSTCNFSRHNPRLPFSFFLLWRTSFCCGSIHMTRSHFFCQLVHGLQAHLQSSENKVLPVVNH